MKGHDVIEVIDALEEASVHAWIGDGGWGIDALLGEETREHADVDVIVPVSEVQLVADTLSVLGFRLIDGEPPTCFVLGDGAGRRVDVHPVEFNAAGDGVYKMQSGATWIYPARGFSARGTIAGRKVRCLTPEVELMCRTGYQFDAGDVRDMLALKRRFGVQLSPEQERARVSMGIEA